MRYRMNAMMMVLALLGAGAVLLVGCPQEDGDDDSVADDDDSVADDDDTATDDDDTATDDDDSATDDDDTATDDDDDTGPVVEPVIDDLSWAESAPQCNGPPALALADDGGGVLGVQVTSWEIQCCLELTASAAMDGATTVRIDIVDVGHPCDCVACYTVDVAVSELPPGTYDVNVTFDPGNGNSYPLVSGQIEMGS